VIHPFDPCHPCRLGPRLRKTLENVTGIEEWLGFEMETASYLDLFPPKEKLVYLTSDSPNTLTAWDRSATYIIGGIVDRNRLKGATMRKAQVSGGRGTPAETGA
jgi:tRNA (guanine9-N1)-methyltransferase